MKGYLNNIAANGLGLAEVIVPKLASRFEPLSLGRELISKSWGNNGQPSSSPLWDDSWSTAESVEFQTPNLSPRGGNDATRHKISDVQVESNPTPGKISSQRSEEIITASLPVNRSSVHRAIVPEQPSFYSTSSPAKQPIETDLSITKTSRLHDLDQSISRPSNRDRVTEHAGPVDAIESSNFREDMGEERNRFKNSVKGPFQPSMGVAIRPAALEKVSEPQLVATRNEKKTQNRSIEADVDRSEMKSPIRIIEVERTSEAKSRMPVRYLSEPDLTKITQPSMPRTMPSENYPRKYLLRSEAKLAESRLMRKPEPTIQVTIGSIEVKAALPTTRAKSERRAPPVMGLKEYLQNRGGSK